MAAWPDLAALKRAVGVTSDDPGRDEDLQLALDAAIEQTQLDCGVTTAAPSASMAKAARILAVLLAKAEDAPYGIAGVFDVSAVQIAADHPTYQRALAGQRVKFPIA